MEPFSVLISVYCREKATHLNDALLSIWEQTLTPTEVVLVKDGPLTDELEQVINDFKNRYNAIRIVALPQNVGLGAALNEGLKHCSYELVARMDSDDICKPIRFEKQVQYLMQHPQIDIILATGGPGMVKSAYSSGKPALGVGPGNTPALIDETADIEMAVSSILMSKTFDNGMICASEQSVTAVKAVYDAVKAEFIKRGAYILNAKEAEKVANTIVVNGKLNAQIVGQSAVKIAQMAGIKVPDYTKVLIGETDGVGKDYPFSVEKLSPVLAMYKVKDFDAALKRAQ